MRFTFTGAEREMVAVLVNRELKKIESDSKGTKSTTGITSAQLETGRYQAVILRSILKKLTGREFGK